MQAIHAWIQRGCYSEYPQFYIIDHGFKVERSKQYLVPDKFDDFPDCRTIDEVVGLREEYFEEENEVLLVFDEDGGRYFLIIGEFGDE